MKSTPLGRPVAAAVLAALPLAFLSCGAPARPDIVIYGATSGGLAAAIQASRMGNSVVVLEPSRHIGGLTTGGLSWTDIGNKMIIGGISREFYQRIKKKYDDPALWTAETRDQYFARRRAGQMAKDEDAMWTFEPKVAAAVFNEMLAEAKVKVITGARLDLAPGKGVLKQDGRITALVLEDGARYEAQVFIDATYEGDLLAKSGVSYAIGREPNSKYSETWNGVQAAHFHHHQFPAGANVDPYIVPGKPESGLLPIIDPAGPGVEQSGDHRIQAYCFRMCLTDHPENRIPFAKPEGYVEQWYELLLRNYEAGERGLPWINSSMPNRKTDTNNRLGFSTDFIGQNYDYPEAGYAEREAIVARHRLYQQGLMWTLAYHSRMPEEVRSQIAKWGMTRDEFTEGGGWQGQLYIREARRMIGGFVMTQNHCQQRERVEDSVGMGAYTMDSHHVQRHVDAAGHVRNEGDVQVGGFPPEERRVGEEG
ncbi:MAG TPA: FAD-dependent oxidoreductase, partial [Solibacterales bacterium]|nr:FAD-dependent oxidoreductase [Bryobacterales bacterium]